MKKIICHTLLSCLITTLLSNFNWFDIQNNAHQIQAQTVTDALLYSQITTSGNTARSLGIGGAFGALGGDFSSATINPAGMGLYQKNEFIITPSYGLSSSKTSYLTQNNNDNFSGFGLSNVALIFSNKKKKIEERKRAIDRYYRAKRQNPNRNIRPPIRSNWISTTMSFGISQVKNFNNNAFLQGENTFHSITDFLAEQANGYSEAELYNFQRPFDSSLAYHTYLIDPDLDNLEANQYTGVAQGGNILQRRYTNERGGMNEGVVSFAGNYREAIYLGATLSIPFVNYEYQEVFEESNVANGNADFASLRLVDNLNVTGQGINLKLGAIYRVDSLLNKPLAVRIGGAFHTPTAFTLSETFNSVMTSEFNNGDSFREESPDGTNSYNITTPWRAVASASFVVYKKGFISVDYEYVDYSNNQVSFNSEDDSFTAFANELNASINNTLTSASNLRIGAELLFKPLQVRVGYAHYGNPYAEGNSGSVNRFSAGVGVRFKSFYTDLALTHARSKYFYQPYELNALEVGTAEVLRSSNNLAMSVGIRF